MIDSVKATSRCRIETGNLCDGDCYFFLDSQVGPCTPLPALSAQRMRARAFFTHTSALARDPGVLCPQRWPDSQCGPSLDNETAFFQVRGYDRTNLPAPESPASSTRSRGPLRPSLPLTAALSAPVVCWHSGQMRKCHQSLGDEWPSTRYDDRLNLVLYGLSLWTGHARREFLCSACRLGVVEGRRRNGRHLSYRFRDKGD